jgi:hypothetical protein
MTPIWARRSSSPSSSANSSKQPRASRFPARAVRRSPSASARSRICTALLRSPRSCASRSSARAFSCAACALAYETIFVRESDADARARLLAESRARTCQIEELEVSSAEYFTTAA